MSFFIGSSANRPSTHRSHSTPTRTPSTHHHHNTTSSTTRHPTKSSHTTTSRSYPYTNTTTRSPYYATQPSATSYYRRRPRSGYISRLLSRIKRLLRELYGYVRAHPVKVLLPLVMALVSSGALAGWARKVGAGGIGETLAGAVGAGRSARGGWDAWAGDDGFRSSGIGGGGEGGSMGGVVKGLVKVAGAFL